jgi:3-dehydroquinate dehydratase II
LDRRGQLCYARSHVTIDNTTSGCRVERPEHEHARSAPAASVWQRNDVEQLCAETGEQLGLAIDFRQTNGEGELVSWVQECRGRAQGIVINPAGYTTTSIALMDALLASELPVIEVHITNIHRREEFRQHSYVSKAAVGVIAGLGVRGYALALTAMADLLLEAGA